MDKVILPHSPGALSHDRSYSWDAAEGVHCMTLHRNSSFGKLAALGDSLSIFTGNFQASMLQKWLQLWICRPILSPRTKHTCLMGSIVVSRVGMKKKMPDQLVHYYPYSIWMAPSNDRRTLSGPSPDGESNLMTLAAMRGTAMLDN